MRLSFLFSNLLTINAKATQMESTEFPLVETEYGPVKGLKTKTVFGVDYLSFRGIPYMKAPLGQLRFREAQSPRNWTDTYDATEEGPSYCMTDFVTNLQDGQENAGTVNVYTKNLKPDCLYPVMIWVHGGGFCRGSSRTDLYGPDYLLEKDVILVSFNYRLGVIGFLSLDDPFLEIPGNVGLKDQIFALKWIQRNIEKFGGDPKRCTVFGESAGGSSVHYLTITQHTKGLFQRAIIMSGSALNKTWCILPRKNQAERLARKLGWKGKSGDEASILEFLENVPAFELDDASKGILTDEETFGYGMLIPFGPVVEPYESDNCFVTRDPILMAREAWSNEIDVIVMGTSFEGILRAGFKEAEASQVLQNPSFFVPLLEFGLTADDGEAAIWHNDGKGGTYGETIKRLYYQNGEEPSIDNQEQYLRFLSDFHFWHGLHRLMQSRHAHASGKTFLMRFDVDGELNVFKALKKGQKYKGACHADDLFHLFTTAYHDPPPPDSKEFKAIQRIVGIFTSFAISGDPNCSEIPSLIIKPNDGAEPLKCLNITENGVEEIPLPEEETLKVWDSVYDAFGAPLY